MSKSKRASRGANPKKKTPEPPIHRPILTLTRLITLAILLFGFWIVFKPTYPPASAREQITEIHLSVDNLFGDELVIAPIIVIDEERRRQELENVRIAEEKRKAALARNLTVNYGACSCVRWVQNFYPNVRTTNGWAITYPINSQTPRVGAVIVTYESSYGSFRTGHVGIVSAIENGNIVISEANFFRCRVTHGRTLPIGSPLIKGFYL